MPRLTVMIAAFFALLPHVEMRAADPERWENLIPAITPSQSRVAGNWSKSDGGLLTTATPGSRLMLPARPTGEYDFRVSFTRRTGKDSIGLFFVSGGKQTAFEVDAWGEHLAGLQLLDGKDLRANPTRVANQTLENGRRYSLEVRIRKDRVEAMLDDKVIVTHRSNGSDFSMLDLWRLPNATSLGIAAWNSETLFHSIEVRRVSGELNLGESTSRAAPSTTASTTKPTPLPSTTPTSSLPTNPTPAQSVPTTGKRPRVLIVIANMHFFYREYSEPRQELERAGCLVEVAAGRKETCYPHPGTGEGADRGAVTPDLAIANAEASRYDAILFSGGWGSSMYQYAFQGLYQNSIYNGDRRIKEATNKLINDFVKQDKYVAGLCHGVSVLAWSRVNGRSLLAGKRATGPTLNGPGGHYPGYQGTPPSRWNSETNGAVMVPPNSVGDPSTLTDDVVIDGKVLTGQDDPTAREMGRQLARLLTGR